MFDDLPSGLVTLRAIVMVWTSDHLAQCKVGAVKNGGYFGCRCHYVTSRWRARSGNKGLVEYHDNKKHNIVCLIGPWVLRVILQCDHLMPMSH
jgi:hypothetical protein